MTERKFDDGGYIASPGVQVLVIPWADRDNPKIPPNWPPHLVIAAEECILDLDMKCVRSDHPHRRTS